MGIADDNLNRVDGAKFASRLEENSMRKSNPWDSHITRREFVVSAGTITGAAVLGVPTLLVKQPKSTDEKGQQVEVKFRINGVAHQLALDPRITLLDLLRENLGMTGTKKGCDHGQCGACTVLANDRRINSCLSLAVVHDGENISTIEGLSQDGNLHPLQAAFIEHDGFQCGYCTPGQICSAIAMMGEVRDGHASYMEGKLSPPGHIDLTLEEIRERMSGNLCRCGAYPGIVQAIQSFYPASKKVGSEFRGGHEPV